MLLICLVATAKEFEVVNGKATYVKEEGAVSVSFDWKGAKWDNKTDLKEHLAGEYEKYKSEGKKAFIEGFNKKAKKLNASDNAKDAKFKITVKVISLDKYYNVMTLVPGNKHKITAEITVTENGNEICKMKSDELEGDRDFSIFDSYTKAMNALGEHVAKGK